MRKIKNFGHLVWSIYWTVRCGYPAKKLYVIGVTGTDGKTTTCTLIYEVLKAAGIKAGLLSTVNAKIGNEEIDTGLHTTNPGPEILQPILKKAVAAGATHMVLEVTSHGLDQNRVWGCNFQIGVLTNVTHEHLDYHKTFANYRETKLKLFSGVKYAVLNRDDPSYEYMKTKIQDPRSKMQLIPYTKTNLKNISPDLAGDYNKYNIGAAEAVAGILGIKGGIVARVVKNFAGVPGRREEVRAGQNFRVIVDFAHTPNALEVVLTQLRKELPPGGRLMAVFGCTGERDKGKRPMMGEIATRLADGVILTSDDTRSENQDDIYEQILAGIPAADEMIKKGTLVKENDRRKAIEIAVKTARAGDIILLAGKGHEKSILIGKTDRPWSDQREASRAISGLINRAK